MLIWSLVVLALVLFYVGITVHELGHAYGCRRVDVPVKEISVLGWKLPRVPGIELPIKSRTFPQTRWVVHPFIVGAYMQPDEDRMKALTRRDRVAILAAGPVASCLYGFALLALAAVLATIGAALGCGDCGRTAADAGDAIDPASIVTFGIAAVVSTALFGLCYALRWSRWLHGPLLGLGVIATPLLLYVFGIMISEAVAGQKPWSEVFVGPFGLVRICRDAIASAVTDDGATTGLKVLASAVAMAMALAGGLSVFIGIANMAPLIAGDGTMIIMEYLPDRAAQWLYRVTIAIVVALLVFGVVGDALWVWEWWHQPAA